MCSPGDQPCCAEQPAAYLSYHPHINLGRTAAPVAQYAYTYLVVRQLQAKDPWKCCVGAATHRASQDAPCEPETRNQSTPAAPVTGMNKADPAPS
jgi:hypothetical protein